MLFCDNGSEFSSQVMDLWAYHSQVKIDFSRAGQTDRQWVCGGCGATYRVSKDGLKKAILQIIRGQARTHSTNADQFAKREPRDVLPEL